MLSILKTCTINSICSIISFKLYISNKIFVMDYEQYLHLMIMRYFHFDILSMNGSISLDSLMIDNFQIKLLCYLQSELFILTYYFFLITSLYLEILRF